MHVLPRVRQLHERFQGSLEVIGVHAGKFSTERHTDRIEQACERLGVRHPVVNDRQFRIWHDYAVHAWPTIALIDPEGYLVGVQPGEFPVDAMSDTIGNVIARAEERGTLRPGAGISVSTPDAAARSSALSFPARAVLADGSLWVSDTGHRRVLRCDWSEETRSATVTAEFGGLREPRGIAVTATGVYVADRAAHSVVRLTPDGGHVPVAGTGTIAERKLEPGLDTGTPLRSPWGLAEYDGGIAIAMAGAHQLWRLDPNDGRLEHFAGRGGEDIDDGQARSALLAQPTGLSSDGVTLAFADCETSAVRLLGRDYVRTVVGTGLFDFGDRDGEGDNVLLQHAEDVTWHDGILAVADTYNDRLKAVDPLVRTSVPWRGAAGEAGALREPGGVSSDGRTLLVADTGNHRVVGVEADGSLTEVRFA